MFDDVLIEPVLRQVCDVNDSGIAICDINGKIVYSNKSFDKLIGSPAINTIIHNYVVENKRDKHKLGFEQVFKSDKDFNIVFYSNVVSSNNIYSYCKLQVFKVSYNDGINKQTFGAVIATKEREI